VIFPHFLYLVFTLTQLLCHFVGLFLKGFLLVITKFELLHVFLPLQLESSLLFGHLRPILLLDPKGFILDGFLNALSDRTQFQSDLHTFLLNFLSLLLPLQHYFLNEFLPLTLKLSLLLGHATLVILLNLIDLLLFIGQGGG
jgi:hypothetical protein